MTSRAICTAALLAAASIAALFTWGGAREQVSTPRSTERSQHVAAWKTPERPNAPPRAREHVEAVDAVGSATDRIEATRLIAASFDQLAAAAEAGDARAARTLYEAMAGCGSTPSTLAEGAARVDALRAASRTAGDSKQASGLATLADLAESTQSRCRFFSAAQLQRQWEFIERAAELGDNVARKDYFLMRRPLDPNASDYALLAGRHNERAREFLLAAVADGDVEALGLLSIGYQSGRLGLHDDVAAYRYAFAHALADSRATHIAGAPRARAARLAEMRSRLSDEDISASETEAQRIIARCCARAETRS